MVKILSADQIKALDQHTIAREPISSIDLMERASSAFVDWFTERFHGLKKVGIVCGTGNNGGDGLAIGRLLKEWGYPVKIWIVGEPETHSDDFKVNLARLSEKKIEFIQTQSTDEVGLTDRDVIIDAIFGYGLSRPIEGLGAEIIERINRSEAVVVSVDMPSGLMADKPSSGPCIKAQYTITFHAPKLSLFLPSSYKIAGEWTVVDIGLNKEYVKELSTTHYWVTQKAVRRMIRKRGLFDHKGTFGHALLVAGSYGKVGASVLTSKAILRSGVGLLTVYAPGCGYGILQTSVPEAMVLVDPGHEVLTTMPDISKVNVIGIGPGIGQAPETVTMVRELFGKADQPMVIDADALNILGSNREIFHLIPEGSILTPHPKEFERLVGEWSNDFQRLEKQIKLSKDLKSVIVLKGAYTSIACPDGKVIFNSTGNPGMATGGTGDVLTGILTGLLAQGYDAETSAILGVYLHGSAGDLALIEKGEDSLIASDVIDFLPAAFRLLKR